MSRLLPVKAPIVRKRYVYVQYVRKTRRDSAQEMSEGACGPSETGGHTGGHRAGNDG